MKARIAKYDPNPNSERPVHRLVVEIPDSVVRRLGGCLYAKVELSTSRKALTITFCQKGPDCFRFSNDGNGTFRLNTTCFVPARLMTAMKLAEVETNLHVDAGRVTLTLPSDDEIVPPSTQNRGSTKRRADQGDGLKLSRLRESIDAVNALVSELDDVGLDLDDRGWLRAHRIVTTKEEL